MGIENSSFVRKNHIGVPIIVITGVCRSGKTLLGNLLATCPSIEYADEPYTGMLMPMVTYAKKIDLEFAKDWFSNYLRELFNDLLLLRRVNFRPNDLSSVWSKKTPQEILYRLAEVNNRKDVMNLAEKQRSKLLVTLSECTPFVDFINDALPEVKIIHVIRNGFDVAREVEDKKWFSDEQLLRPLNAQLYVPYKHCDQIWHLPWWVKDGEEAYFLQLSDYERSLYYWAALMNKGLEGLSKLDKKEIVVYYEELISKPKKEFDRVSKQIGVSRGELSDMMIDNVSKNEDKEVLNTNIIDEKLLALVLATNSKVGYNEY